MSVTLKYDKIIRSQFTTIKHRQKPVFFDIDSIVKKGNWFTNV